MSFSTENPTCRTILNSQSVIDCSHRHFEYKYRELWCDACKSFYQLSASGYLPEESKEIEFNAIAGFAKDPERALYALEVSTSEALIRRVSYGDR